MVGAEFDGIEVGKYGKLLDWLVEFGGDGTVHVKEQALNWVGLTCAEGLTGSALGPGSLANVKDVHKDRFGFLRVKI